LKNKTLSISSNEIKDFDQLEELVDELMKQKPQEERIKAYMKNVGLEYIADPIMRLGTVLQAIEGKKAN
jgi:hypothetical protein